MFCVITPLAHFMKSPTLSHPCARWRNIPGGETMEVKQMDFKSNQDKKRWQNYLKNVKLCFSLLEEKVGSTGGPV